MPASLFCNEICVSAVCTPSQENGRRKENAKTETKLIYMWNRLSISGVWCAKQMCAKSCCEIVAKLYARVPSSAVIKRNRWQQPKPFEQKKGNPESGSIATKKMLLTLSRHLLLLSLVFVKNPNQLPNRSAFVTHFPSIACVLNGLTTRLCPHSLISSCVVRACSDFTENLMT